MLTIQESLTDLYKWTKKWSTELNLSKCKTIFIGKNRQHIGYSVLKPDGELILEEKIEEKDLGVYITSDLKWNRQCSTAATKANRILGQIRASFSFLDKETLRLLYAGLVRTQLEYAVSTWNP
ncbi:unnamed protein product [Brachionus calyciflorus]|uniref:Uncharacterized protein n=1 Tax=Brachionus calyciflorus TaxID=104777 RepID=A0A814F3K3_9BILA|nr:unnamed protein product [Brachionus calyciflorus]